MTAPLASRGFSFVAVSGVNHPEENLLDLEVRNWYCIIVRRSGFCISTCSISIWSFTDRVYCYIYWTHNKLTGMWILHNQLKSNSNITTLFNTSGCVPIVTGLSIQRGKKNILKPSKDLNLIFYRDILTFSRLDYMLLR